MDKRTNIIELKHITKTYEDGFSAVTDFNLEVKQGEFITFLGPSGCGKTTTLRMIAGFDIPTEGEILLNGEPITSLPPNKRPINTVFQRYALFPHMNIFDNIAFGLKQRKMPKRLIEKKVKKALELVDLEGFENRKTDTLSGGQQQRVAIARALVTKPAIILADEPTGNLDSRTTQEVLGLLKLTSEQFHQTVVMITHNEALAQLCSRVIHIEDGRIVSDYGKSDARSAAACTEENGEVHR